MIDYNSATDVLQDPHFIVYIILTWSIPLLLYFIIGVLRKARSGDGRVLSTPMIFSSNYWWAVLIYGLLQLILFIGLIFPIWIRAFN